MRARYVPMSDGIGGWIVKTAKRNFWRVAHWIDFDDLCQDGQRLFYETQQRYAKVREPAHVMALFKRTYVNHIHDMARARRRMPELQAIEAALELPCEYSEALALIAGAPVHVRAAIVALMTRKERVLVRRRNGIRETWNRKLCRLAGVDPRCNDVYGDMLRYLHVPR